MSTDEPKWESAKVQTVRARLASGLLVCVIEVLQGLASGSMLSTAECKFVVLYLL
jgi:hypothetical protein